MLPTLNDPCKDILINCECSFIYIARKEKRQTPCSAGVEYQGAYHESSGADSLSKETC